MANILIEMYQKWKEKRERMIAEREDLPDDVTTDRYLRSLRRQRRMIDEEFEKERLKKEIRQHYLNKTNEQLWGIVKQRRQRRQARAMLQASYDITNSKTKKKLYKL